MRSGATKKIPTAILHRFETEKWKDTKNAIDRKENSRTRIKEGRGFENWKKVLDVLDKIFVCMSAFCVCMSAFFKKIK